MIKEKKKQTKYNFVKSKKQIFLEYTRTIFFSFLAGVIITSCLAIQSRNEMIKNIYLEASIQKKIDKETALNLISQKNLLENLSSKKYSVCMNIAELYEAAGDYKDAKDAYEEAIRKSTPNNYTPYYRLLCVLAELEDFDSANAMLNHIKDVQNKKLLKFKTRSYITLGDKYYSIGKFLSAAKSFEKAEYYYNKFSKKDKKIENSIKERIVNSYIETADIMVKTGLNSDAIRFLKKAETHSPNNNIIKYKLAIILTDSNPEKAISYLEDLLEKTPQDIDYSLYGTALMKAANIADLEGRTTVAKYYRYKIHSIDLFLNRKVVYKNDIETNILASNIKKLLFKYNINQQYSFLNTSNTDIINLYADFELLNKNKIVEVVTLGVADKNKPLLTYSEPNIINVKFKKKFFTKKELENYTIRVLLYKDSKYKTKVLETNLITSL